MKKTTTTANHNQKGRNTAAAAKTNTKHPNRMYTEGKKIAGRIMNILNYQYKESDLQFVL
jgi:hypothetical protein